MSGRWQARLTALLALACTAGCLRGGHGTPLPAARLADGGAHTCAVRADGTLWCWGGNGYGQLGDCSTHDRSEPVQVTDLGAAVASVAAGGIQTCAVKTDGTLWCWGGNESGQVGDGSNDDRHSPVELTALGAGVAEVTAGNQHTCARKTDGTLWCWGADRVGQLGDGSTTARAAPVQVVALGTSVVGVVAGGEQTCARKTDGTLWCWGARVFDDGVHDRALAPMRIPLGDIASVSVGQEHACAVKTDGSLWCWGDNGYGELGTGAYVDDGTYTYSSTKPREVSALGGSVVGVAAGADRTCAWKKDGSTWCWGSSQISSETGCPTPERGVPAPAPVGAAVEMASPGTHTCARDRDGRVLCWGGNAYGELGDGTRNDRCEAASVPGFPDGPPSDADAGAGDGGDGNPGRCGSPPCTDVSAVSIGSAIGSASTYAVRIDGTLWGWGANDHGQLGDGTTVDRPLPVAVLGLGTGVTSAAIGQSFACAVRSDGSVWCWGANDRGELGDGTTVDRGAPAAVAGLTAGVASIAAGLSHACAVRTDGSLWCWGANIEGCLGDGTAAERDAPVEVVGPSEGVGAVTAGQAHTCALKKGGSVWCWGANFLGELGNGTTTASRRPVAVPALTSDVVAVSAGGDFTCALKTDGSLWCWGHNGSGEIGTGKATTAPVTTPTRVVADGRFTAVSAGWAQACAIKADGALLCWGAHGQDPRDDSSSTDRSAPSVVSGLTGVAAVAAGDGDACAVKTDGSLVCWGSNAFGQLGDGTTTSRRKPVPVLGCR